MVHRPLLLSFLLLVLPAFGSTVGNDDSCDVTVLPAATLLLPSFEVDLDHVLGETTLFDHPRNGCSPRVSLSEVVGQAVVIGPAPNTKP